MLCYCCIYSAFLFFLLSFSFLRRLPFLDLFFLLLLLLLLSLPVFFTTFFITAFIIIVFITKKDLINFQRTLITWSFTLGFHPASLVEQKYEFLSEFFICHMNLWSSSNLTWYPGNPHPKPWFLKVWWLCVWWKRKHSLSNLSRYQVWSL